MFIYLLTIKFNYENITFISTLNAATAIIYLNLSILLIEIINAIYECIIKLK